MKPSELYSREPQETSSNLDYLIGCYYNFIPEVLEEELLYRGELRENDRVEIRIYKYFDFDGRRFWRLSGVFFNGSPVMITQNAGREGDDFTGRFITDVGAYKKMIKYVRTLLPVPEEEEIPDVVSEDNDITGLADFYGNSLDGLFERYRY